MRGIMKTGCLASLSWLSLLLFILFVCFNKNVLAVLMFIGQIVFVTLWIKSIRKETKLLPPYDAVSRDIELSTSNQIKQKARQLYFENGDFRNAYPYLLATVKSLTNCSQNKNIQENRDLGEIGDFCWALLNSAETVLKETPGLNSQEWKDILLLVKQKSPLTLQRFIDTVEENEKDPFYQQSLWWDKAEQYEANNDYLNAISAYENIIALGSKSLTPFEHIRKIYKKQGNTQAVIICMEKALEMMLNKWDLSDPKVYAKVDNFLAKYKRYVKQKAPQHSSLWIRASIAKGNQTTPFKK